MEAVSIRVEDIQVGERHRALSDDAVQRLAVSMRDIGLRQPISVRVVEEMMMGGELTAGVPVLVAGAHRLAAAKMLGWTHIDCVEVDDDPIAAELWEIAENLHRLDLTKEQKYEHLRRYARLIEMRDAAALQSGQRVQIESQRDDGRGHRQKEIASRVAAETGVSAKTVKRAFAAVEPKPAAAPPPRDAEEHNPSRKRLMSAWNSATSEDRAWFRDWIDEPIMDARHAA